ncbi:hypothetical protein [Paenarthrobacter sp. NPDC089316]|uniref:hypothetical protein n=1 Tax=unclassified Paenarthrobacter TaxID=2634190 RepID=UPI00343BF27F
MPYQSETSQSSARPARGTPSGARAGTVIPAVDLYLGTVTIVARNNTMHFRHPQPRQIAAALAQAVRPSTWCEASRTLTVTIAAVGKRDGQPRTFTFDSREGA